MGQWIAIWVIPHLSVLLLDSCMGQDCSAEAKELAQFEISIGDFSRKKVSSPQKQ